MPGLFTVTSKKLFLSGKDGVISSLVHFNFSFSFYALNMDDSLKVKKALYMFVDLFGTERFEYETLVRFIITIRKNYRQVSTRFV